MPGRRAPRGGRRAWALACAALAAACSAAGGSGQGTGQQRDGGAGGAGAGQTIDARAAAGQVSEAGSGVTSDAATDADPSGRSDGIAPPRSGSPGDGGAPDDGRSGALPDAASLAGARPNVLLAIADDLGYPFTGAYGESWIKTPAFDRVAREGVLFTHAFVSAPSCSPSRAALLTGRNFWELGQASTLWTIFPRDLVVYPELLERAGYRVGLTGKGWGPGEVAGGARNPAGPNIDFAQLLARTPRNTPFAFWFGSNDPHRPYDPGSGLRAGKRLEDARVPRHLPDTDEIRGDLLDYAFEIERFDRDVGRLLDLLHADGRLEDTIVIVTGDNGMPFPRAKANVHDLGARVPLAIRWGARVRGGRRVDDMVSLIDLAPTLLQAAGVAVPSSMSGRSLLPLLAAGASGRVEPDRDKAFIGVDRHANARDGNKGFPVRAVRTRAHLYVRNYRPQLWPAGNPEAYKDIDDGPTKAFLLANRSSLRWSPLFRLACANRPEEELYDLEADPGQLYNVAALPAYAAIKQQLAGELARRLAATGDPVAAGRVDVMDAYPYVGAGALPAAVPPGPPFTLAPP